LVPNITEHPWVLPSIAFLTTFLVYLVTLCPSIYPGDSAEFVAASWTLGIPHPPGYPLYVCLGRAFSLVFPVGSIPFRINLLSAIFVSTTVVLLVVILRRLVGDWRISLSVPLFLGWSPAFWTQAAIAEVYSLELLFIALILWVDIGRRYSIDTDEKNRRLYLETYLMSLAVCYRPTLALIPVALALAYAASRGFTRFNRPKIREVFSAAGYRRISVLKLLVILPVTSYLFLVLRGRLDPAVHWRGINGFKQVLAHILGVEYYRYLFSSGMMGLGAVLPKLGKTLFAALGVHGLVLTMLGVWAAVGRRPGLFIWLNLYAFLNLGFALVYRVYDPEMFISGSLLVFALDLAFGLLFLKETRQFSFSDKARNWVLTFLVIAIPAGALAGQSLSQNRSNYYFAYDYAKAVMESPDYASRLVLADDNTIFPACYLRNVENFRPDLLLYDPSGVLFNSAPQDSSGWMEFLRRSAQEGKRVFFSSVPAPGIRTLFPVGIKGVDFYIMADSEEIPFEVPVREPRDLVSASYVKDPASRKALRQYLWLRINQVESGEITEDNIKYFELMAKLDRADPSIYLVVGQWYLTRNAPYLALKYYDRGLKYYGDDPRLLLNKGVCLSILGREQQAENCYKAALESGSQDEEVLRRLARMFVRRGMVKEARQSLKRLLEQAPGDQWAREQLDRLR